MKYRGANTKEIIFPLGGIGSGSVGFSGEGRLVDWEIFNRPSKGSDNGYSHLAVRAETENGVICKVLNGDYQKDLMGHYIGDLPYAGYGYGPRTNTMAGFSHFREWEFDGEYPMAALSLRDPEFPAAAKITVFNPFIPNDSGNSSIPGAFFEVALTNEAEKAVTYTVAFTLANPYDCSRNARIADGSGVFLKNAGANPADVEYGDMTLQAQGARVGTQVYWYRGGWQDGVSTYWREFTSEKGLSDRIYDTDGKNDTCTVWVTETVPAGETMKARFVMTWNVPNCYNYWNPLKDEAGKDVSWKNWYATQWKDSRESAAYSMKKWDELMSRTELFRRSLWNSTVDPAVIDAAASTLSVLHSPTVLRLEDGTLYGWEGAMERVGSCEGSCTHVWNYAYAACFLFPDLERSMREVDYKVNLQPDGAMRFRYPLPVGRPGGWPMPCVDGQMGGVIKVFREWKLCGDSAWLRKIWPDVKKSLEFAWSPENRLEWDGDKDGVLEGRQHHTLDMELFGPSSWLEGLYLAALKAGAEMAEALGEPESAEEYMELFGKGQKWMEENLFNGKWYFQKVNLNDREKIVRYNDAYNTLQSSDSIASYWNTETGEIKYQIGEGSAIDQMLGQWHAVLCGLGDIFDPENRKTAMDSLYKNNFKPTFRSFTNPWRNYAVNDDAGTIICDYPDGVYKPTIPIPYCEETMHGFEYSAAGLFMSEGRVGEAVRMVKAVRDRYNGFARNPYNEIECGNNYARSMAAFGFLPILSGFRFDLTKGMIGFNPVEKEKTFRTVWSVDGAWGTVEIDGTHARIEVLEGALRANRFELPGLEKITAVKVNGEDAEYAAEGCAVVLPEKVFTGVLEVRA